MKSDRAGAFRFTGKIELFQNFPNPVKRHTVTSIPYKAIDASTIELVIYSMGGARIFSITHLKAGVGELAVDTKDMMPGVYTYALLVNGRMTHKRKMVVLE